MPTTARKPTLTLPLILKVHALVHRDHVLAGQQGDAVGDPARAHALLVGLEQRPAEAAVLELGEYA